MELLRLMQFAFVISIVVGYDVFNNHSRSKNLKDSRKIDEGGKAKISVIKHMLNNSDKDVTNKNKAESDSIRDIYRILERDKNKKKEKERKSHDDPLSNYLPKNKTELDLTDKVAILKGIATTSHPNEVNKEVQYYSRVDGVYCNFEYRVSSNGTIFDDCKWTWNDTASDYGNGFSIFNAKTLMEFNRSKSYMLAGPDEDADGNSKGNFLYLPLDDRMEQMAIKSPYFPGLFEFCKFEMMIHTSKMQNGIIKVIAEVPGEVAWIVQEFSGNFESRWQPHTLMIGKVQQDLRIVIEIIPPNDIDMTTILPHIAIDNIRMVDCFPEAPIMGGICQPGQLKCKIREQDACLKIQQVCDLVKDCDDELDEQQNCDKIPYGGYCDFERDNCGFKDRPGNVLKWLRHSGPTPTDKTGPNFDHTCGPPNENQAILPPFAPMNRTLTACEGWYFYVNMNVTGPNSKPADFASTAVMTSVVFNPPPKVHSDNHSKFYNSCMIRFYYQQNGRNFGSLSVTLVKITNMGNLTENLWFSTKDKGVQWHRAAIFLPHITSRYFFEFQSRMGMRIYSDAAIDDFSMAPECFGLNIPAEELGDYNYYDPLLDDFSTVPHEEFQDKPIFEFTTCNNTGRFGPTQSQCDESYNITQMVNVLDDDNLKGVQTWEVPSEGYYTIVAIGASGGLGSSWRGITQGAQITALFHLDKGEILHLMIGQQGVNSCKKTLSTQFNSTCAKFSDKSDSNMTALEYFMSKPRAVMNTVLKDGGGGGGGATYIFTVDEKGNQHPLVIAGGGGGLSVGVFVDDNGTQHGQAFTDKNAREGMMHGSPGQMAGAGGGWRRHPNGAMTEEMSAIAGGALVLGGIGGSACAEGVAVGGWGGGGGACKSGGGGGGWIGGDAELHTNGDGGWSYVDAARSVSGFTSHRHATHMGSGRAYIIPAHDGCGCDYRCVALNEYRSRVKCFCPAAWRTSNEDQTKCVLGTHWSRIQPYMVYILAGATCVGLLVVLCMCLYLYNQMQRRRESAKRKKHLEEHEFQLRRLRNPPTDNAFTSFNPYYGCDGVLAAGIDVRGLPQVSRESLKLVKALGQGAFGEVYQGLYKHREGDSIEMAVAVKTLPELSSSQAEADFLMEAAIMAKFSHPNIVHLIGVCFDSHPRFIVLELLAGGDLKNFLRESRPKPERCSALTMKDLLLAAIDVARGCKYMEAKRFIHRDIAARNCLLTTRGPGRVVKIADFGMSRDIYRSDYYRKGGKALLPIKWMPPEAYMDGVFTTKTDVWSFGVLLWEVFSLGVMPYTGCANKEVMDMVGSGGRLEAPFGCPPEIYKLMCESWNPNPDQRPTFIQIYDRLTLMQDDPEIVDMPLPVTKPMISMDSLSTCSGNQQVRQETPPGSEYLVPRHHTADQQRLRDTVASSSSTDPLLDHSESLLGPDSPPPKDSEFQPLVKASRDYGNILATVGPVLEEPHGNTSGNKTRIGILNSKSTERLLTDSQTVFEEGSSGEMDKPVVWETSFTELPKPKCEKPPNNAGPPVDKLISIDTPQQTPTSTVPPENTLNTKATFSDSPKINKKPLTLDAAQLEENLNALKKNRGSVNLNSMNIQVPAYINVVTPRVKESKTIKIDPKNAVIQDSPEKTLKQSASAASLLNGPLTEVPFADSESSSNSSGNFINIKNGGKKIIKKQTSNSLNESEISC